MTNARQDGFTLIELLVVVAIIGILAAIAIPAFSAYRADGYDAHASAALNSLAKAEEAYFISSGRYTTNITQLPPYYPPNGVVLTVTAVTNQDFTAESYHPLGSKRFRWDSSQGGLQQ
jgi:prepilin-type N-terminal cleavage/methylation domain-containing protein